MSKPNWVGFDSFKLAKLPVFQQLDLPRFPFSECKFTFIEFHQKIRFVG